MARQEVSDHVVKDSLEVLVGFSDVSLGNGGLRLVLSAGELLPGSTLVLEPGLDDLWVEAVGDDGISDGIGDRLGEFGDILGSLLKLSGFFLNPVFFTFVLVPVILVVNIVARLVPVKADADGKAGNIEVDMFADPVGLTLYQCDVIFDLGVDIRKFLAVDEGVLSNKSDDVLICLGVHLGTSDN